MLFRSLSVTDDQQNGGGCAGGGGFSNNSLPPSSGKVSGDVYGIVVINIHVNVIFFNRKRDYFSL